MSVRIHKGTEAGEEVGLAAEYTSACRLSIFLTRHSTIVMEVLFMDASHSLLPQT